MARKLRVQYPGALYHIINRGNYRSPIFGTKGATKAFERCLAESCERHGWRVHAFVVMSNHYHLALETPQPNLAGGMQWLQATFAARFNRYRTENGHVFQGRYKAILVEDFAALFRVANYIHLNPVRAKIVAPAALATYRMSSLARYLEEPLCRWLISANVLGVMGLTDHKVSLAHYREHLIALATDAREQERQDFATLSSGWAIGTRAWRAALAREYSDRALSSGLAADEARQINEIRWGEELRLAFRAVGKSESDVHRDPKGAPWKIALAVRLRRNVAAPYRWIATVLHMGSPLAVRVNVCRFVNR